MLSNVKSRNNYSPEMNYHNIRSQQILAYHKRKRPQCGPEESRRTEDPKIYRARQEVIY